MTQVIRSIPRQERPGEVDPYSSREWIVTNGIGGYASGTISGVVARRYHGLLISAMPVPFGRILMLAHLSEHIRLPEGQIVKLFSEENLRNVAYTQDLKEFRLEAGLPVWHYEFGGFVLEKRVSLVYGQNTVHITYKLVSGEGKLRLKLRPYMNIRHHDAPVNTPVPRDYGMRAYEGRYEFSASEVMPELKMTIFGENTAFTVEGKTVHETLYSIEEHRGYEFSGDLYSPGYFRVDLEREKTATLVASTEDWDTALALTPEEAEKAERERRERLLSDAAPEAREGFGAELVYAADQFIITPSGRVEDAARAKAAGDDIRTVIAGYHWFTDWGRDTMIGLEGLTLTTGRRQEAGYILKTFSHYVREGLIPNMFPEGGKEGLYHTADATLWYFHAVDRYMSVTGDLITLRRLLPVLKKIISCHVKGTRFGIKAEGDGLIAQGAEGFQLTWMDAKVEGWVVTPRRGKAVEINALWYNALKLMEKWVRMEEGVHAALFYAELAEKARESFNRRFWFPEGGYLYDVIDGEGGDDASFRPNQIFSISLPNPVLEEAKWEPVVRLVEERLVTPVGLRSLAPGHPDYKTIYYGDVRTRDAAYHQGTVWAWLIGPFIDAWLKVHPDNKQRARDFLKGFEAHLTEAGAGTISEVFDAESPFRPGGCIAQGWSIAEALRCWVKTTG